MTFSLKTLKLLFFLFVISTEVNAFTGWPQAVFYEQNLRRALHSAFGTIESEPNYNIKIKLSDMNNPEGKVHISVKSDLPDIDSIAFVVEKNPRPIAALFYFEKHAIKAIASTIKVCRPSHVLVYVKSRGKLYLNIKKVNFKQNCTDSRSDKLVDKPKPKRYSIRMKSKMRGSLAKITALILHPMGGHHIKELDVYVNSERALEVKWGPDVPANPILKFGLRNVKKGDEVVLGWTDHINKKTKRIKLHK